MDNLLRERIVQRTRAEARYLRGYQCMNMERFREYQKEFRAAYERCDYRKIGEVVQDTIQISDDTMRLIRKRMAITTRRAYLRVPNGSPRADGPGSSYGMSAPAIPQTPLPAKVAPLPMSSPVRPSPPPAPPAADGVGVAGTPLGPLHT